MPILCEAAPGRPQAGSLRLHKQSPPAWANKARLHKKRYQE